MRYLRSAYNQMNSSQQQNPQSVSNAQTCGRTVCKYCYQLSSCFANFFECDRRFLPMLIIPHEIHFLKNQNPLTQISNKTDGGLNEFDKVPRDSMMAEPVESDRWEEVKTWDWWKRFLCCPYTEDEQNDFATDYDLKEARFVGDQKESGFKDQQMQDKKFRVKGSQNSNDDIIFQDDEMHDDGVSVFSISKSDKPVILISDIVKVNPKQQIADIGIKKKSKGSIHKNFYGEDTSNSELFSPVMKSTIHREGRKISNDFTLSSSGNGQIYSSEPSTVGVGVPLKIAPNVRGQSFDESQYYFNESIKLNSEISYPPNPCSTLPSDTIQKKKRRNNNPFQSSARFQDQFDAVVYNPPEDLSKKRRKKRKDIKQGQKEKEQRAERRGKDEIEVVIFSGDQN